ncbi:nucleotidyltransferase domain-containing protein [bacterium]|nr:MAG: nucleotidyltransferase domain-containing protein [bacterium]
MNSPRLSPQQAAYSFFASHHPKADCVLLAGSFVRGEATQYSDLDLVVLYPELPQAYRESLIWEGYPVESFVHDAQTLHYFFEKMDRPTGFPSLMQMVVEGIEVPKPTIISMAMKILARQVIEAGPEALTEDDLRGRRYRITDLVDDIRAPRSAAELRATGVQLHDALADFYFRSQGLWSARGKTIIRKLRAHSPEFCARFEAAFEALFVAGEARLVIELSEEVMGPYGGVLFAEYRLEAPAEFRIEPQLPFFERD